MHDNRNIRQADIVPDERLVNMHCTVIGVGAIGRQLALQLTALGARNLTLIDFDAVEDVNLATQGYYEEDLGAAKVAATGSICKLLNGELQLNTYRDKFQNVIGVQPLDAVFCCVDSIDTRKEIWNEVRRYKQFWVDGRMLGETLRVLTSAGDQDKYYRSTIFNGREAVHGRCTARATIYSSNVIAGMMLSQFTRWLREEPFHPDILFNLATMDMFFPMLETSA